jgi:hypothetical protein
MPQAPLPRVSIGRKSAGDGVFGAMRMEGAKIFGEDSDDSNVSKVMDA